VYNKAEVTGIIEQYTSKVPIKTIGKNFNCSTTFVYNVLRRHNVERIRNSKYDNFSEKKAKFNDKPKSREAIVNAKKLIIPLYKKYRCSYKIHRDLRKYIKKSSVDRILMWFFYLNGKKIPTLNTLCVSKQYFPKSVEHPHENLYGTPQYNYHEVKSELTYKFETL
jgi:DNA-binding Lrp family transcriptional regulator